MYMRRETAVFLLLIGCFALSGCATSGKGGQASLSERTFTPKAQTVTKDDQEIAPAKGLRLARLLREQGRFEGALSIYSRLDERGKLSPLEKLEYASVASLVQPPRETLNLFVSAQSAIEAKGKGVNDADRAVMHTGLGRAYMSLGQAGPAEQNLRKALTLSPKDVAAMNALGVLLDAGGEHKQAQEMLEKASEGAPADARIINNLALSYVASGDMEKAEMLFNRAKSLSDSTSIKLNLAFTMYMRKQKERARDELLALMRPSQADGFMTSFGQMQQRINKGATSMPMEMMLAANKLVEIQPPSDAPSEPIIGEIRESREVSSYDGPANQTPVRRIALDENDLP